MNRRKFSSIVAILFFAPILFGQSSNEEQARIKGGVAVELMDNGKFDESIKLLKEAQQLDPENYVYPYEMGYAYYVQKDYGTVIKILSKVTHYKKHNDQVYQLLGNAYDLSGKRKKALKIYEKGLEKFPNAGNLYLEMGNIYLMTKKYGTALACYERGIRVNPSFPSNYFWSSKLLLSSDEEVWGMIYGEIFMNLERNTKRTDEISYRLFNTYKSEITFPTDTSYSVSFSKVNSIHISKEDLKDPKAFLEKVHVPFGTGIYEPTLMLSMLGMKKEISLPTLDTMRTKFIENYYKMKNDTLFPVVLFDYERKIIESGNMEAYNYWLLRQGNPEAFKDWRAHNEDKWLKFVEWFNKNQLIVDDSNKFYRH